MGTLPHQFINASKKYHHHTLCEGFLVTDTLSPTTTAKTLLLSDLIYVNGMSLRGLPQKQRLSALRKEVIAGISLPQERTKSSSILDIRNVVLRDCWPKESVESLKTKLIPKLTHGCKGMIVIDAAAGYEYGNQSAHSWLCE